jgi:hypothetical protein
MNTPDLVVLNEQILAEFPSYQVVYKTDSTWMKVINVLLLIITFGQQKQFMTNFVTTMGTTVYVPSSWDTWQLAERCSILRHERIHMRQAKRMTRVLFSLCYVFWPLPMFLSWGRTKLEMEAYEETLAAWKDYGIDPTEPENRAEMISNFTSSSYGWMWPFQNKIAAWYDAAVKRIFS